MTQPRVYENRLNWIADPAPPASRLFNEMTSPAPAPTVPTPPAEVHPRLPGHLRSRRRRRRKAAASANENRPAWLPGQRPGRGQRPIEIRRFLGISLESAWNQPAYEEYPSGASLDLPAPTALTVPQPESQ